MEKILTLEAINANLQSLKEPMAESLRQYASSKFPEGTEAIEFEIRNRSYSYSVIAYPSDGDRTQMGSPQKFLADLDSTGIAVPAELAPAKGSDDYTAEIFCEENHEEITKLIVDWLKDAWALAKVSIEPIKPYAVIQDDDELYPIG